MATLVLVKRNHIESAFHTDNFFHKDQPERTADRVSTNGLLDPAYSKTRRFSYTFPVPVGRMNDSVSIEPVHNVTFLCLLYVNPLLGVEVKTHCWALFHPGINTTPREESVRVARADSTDGTEP